MKDNFMLAGAALAFITVVLGLIKTVIEFRMMRMKNETAASATIAVKAESANSATSRSTPIPEIATIRKQIERAWTQVSLGCAGALMSFVLYLICGLHPAMRGLWWDVASYGMLVFCLVYIVLALLSGRRAVRLHEAVGSLEIIQAVPPLFALFREHIQEAKVKSTEPDK